VLDVPWPADMQQKLTKWVVEAAMHVAPESVQRVLQVVQENTGVDLTDLQGLMRQGEQAMATAQDWLRSIAERQPVALLAGLVVATVANAVTCASEVAAIASLRTKLPAIRASADAVVQQQVMRLQQGLGLLNRLNVSALRVLATLRASCGCACANGCAPARRLRCRSCTQAIPRGSRM